MDMGFQRRNNTYTQVITLLQPFNHNIECGSRKDYLCVNYGNSSKFHQHSVAGTVSNVKGFVMLPVGSLTDAEVVSILNNESGISCVQSSQVMHDGDGWWSWSHPVHDPEIDNFAIVYLLSSQVS